jgi:hypothetical protein
MRPVVSRILYCKLYSIVQTEPQHKNKRDISKLIIIIIIVIIIYL